MRCIPRSIIVMIRLVSAAVCAHKKPERAKQPIRNILYLQFFTVEREMWSARIWWCARARVCVFVHSVFRFLCCSSVSHHLYNLWSCMFQRFTLRSSFVRLLPREPSPHWTCVHFHYALISDMVGSFSFSLRFCYNLVFVLAIWRACSPITCTYPLFG